MHVAKRNHYNPCFWTANWNPRYFANTIAKSPERGRARDQRVHVLNVKSANIYEAAVSNVHYDKSFCVAEMTPDGLMDFCRRHHPDKYEQFCREMQERPETLFLDFESILAGIESGPAYAALMDVVARQRIRAPMEKASIAGFLVVHWYRGHAMMNSMLELSKEIGIKAFEHFIMMKWELSDPSHLYKLAMTLAPFRWHYYRTHADMFPLNDSPVLVAVDKVMVALSPRLMLEIDRTKRQAEGSISHSNYIPEDRLLEFRQRTIRNTFREIIFSSQGLLEEWRDTPEFRDRHALMRGTKKYNEITDVQGNRAILNLNALANR